MYGQQTINQGLLINIRTSSSILISTVTHSVHSTDRLSSPLWARELLHEVVHVILQLLLEVKKDLAKQCRACALYRRLKIPGYLGSAICPSVELRSRARGYPPAASARNDEQTQLSAASSISCKASAGLRNSISQYSVSC